MQLHRPGLPGQLHPLPAGAVDHVVLNQHALGKQPRDAADARVPDGAAAHDVIADQLARLDLVVPALVAHVDGQGVGPVHLAVLDHPVVPPTAGDGPALGHRRAGGGVLADQALHPDVGQEGHLRGKALLPHGELDQVSLRAVVPGQAEVDRLAVGLHPVGALRLGELPVEGHLLQRPAVAEHAAAAVQVGGHVGLVVLDEQPVVQYVHRAEGIVATEHVRVQLVGPHLHVFRPGMLTREAQPPTGTGPEIAHLLGGADHHGAVAEGLEADDVLRVRAAADGPHAFPVQPRVDQHPRARLGQLRRPVDGLQRRFRAAVIVVRGVWRAAVHVQRPVEHGLPLPEFKLPAVRQDRGQVPHLPVLLSVSAFVGHESSSTFARRSMGSSRLAMSRPSRVFERLSYSAAASS